MIHLFSITLSYFIIGVLATFWASRDKEYIVKKERWIKITVYFLIVHYILLVLFLTPYYFVFIAGFIVLCGYYEIIKISIGKNQIQSLVIALILYSLIATGFMYLCWNYRLTEPLASLFVILFIFDGFSQITGLLIGKRKLLSAISPGKTIEGLAGGFTVSLITACFLLHGESLTSHTILSAIVICLAALAGDMAASFYKRIMKVKDYSHLIPGHGGILDRFDSLIAAGCAMAIFYYH